MARIKVSEMAVMIKKTITESHYCDLCKRRIQQSNIKTCIVCNKELCSYCRISLTRVKRKNPDSGYIIKHDICINCIQKIK